MNSLESELLPPHVLTLPISTGHMTLDEDACDVQIECVLFNQQPESTKKPIGYWSRFLTDAKRIIDTTQPECFAYVWAVLWLHYYLESARFSIRTDYHSLKWILNKTDSTGRLARWRLQLSKFAFDVNHRAGVRHQAADALFCLQATGEVDTPLEDDLPLLGIDAKSDDTNILVINADSDETIPLSAQDEKVIDTPQTVKQLIVKRARDDFFKAATLNVG